MRHGREWAPELVAHVGHELVVVLARDLEVLDDLGKLQSGRLNLVEKRRVLDGDHRLVGEDLKRTDFMLGERTDHTARNTDCAGPTRWSSNQPCTQTLPRLLRSARGT